MSTESSAIHPASALALRSALKQSQTQAAQERLFDRLGQRLFDQGWHAAQWQWLLDELCLTTGAAHGLIAQQHAGALKLMAQRGNTYPVGARIPMIGALALWLKAPVKFSLHTQPAASLWTLPASALETLHVYQCPLASQQRGMGLLALVTANPLSDDMQTILHSLCGLLGSTLQLQTQQLQSKTEDHLLQLLTPREREVFALLPSGASNTVLAQKLGISPGTVKIHVERILHKLSVKDRTHAAVKAVEAGFSSEGL